MNYTEFIDNKFHCGSDTGFNPLFMPEQSFDFQKATIEWAVKKGRSAILYDCGLGKSLIELSFAENVVRHTNKPVLILTPLAVAAQTVREGEKFNIECSRSVQGEIKSKIVITNYERLEHFDSSQFAAVVCDESSILKSFDGSIKQQITDFMRKVPYRLLATATAAPNDYIELGTSSEALGEMGFMDMLNKFFKNDLNNSGTKRLYGEAPKWRFKGHAELPFWRWVSSWARACRKPSDLGFENGKFNLPELIERENLIEANSKADGFLFNLPATNLQEQRDEKKRTIQERCEKMASLVSDTKKPAILWCHLNDEADLLEQMIGDSVQISGQEKDEVKEDKFWDFANKKIRVLITKPKIGAWGLNFQHCSHIGYFPSHSYEQYYQAIRRCWRFGQKQNVIVDIVLTEGERKIMENLKRKSIAADKMFQNLVNEMNNAIKMQKINYYTDKEEIPSWL